MKTKTDINYALPWLGGTVLIPKGTPVIPATNLPEEDGPQYWAEPWPGMGVVAESHQRNYGFLITAEEVTP